MTTQTHSAGWTFVQQRPPRKFGEHVVTLLSSASSTTVTQTSHSTFGTITTLKLPPRLFWEL